MSKITKKLRGKKVGFNPQPKHFLNYYTDIMTKHL